MKVGQKASQIRTRRQTLEKSESKGETRINMVSDEAESENDNYSFPNRIVYKDDYIFFTPVKKDKKKEKGNFIIYHIETQAGEKRKNNIKFENTQGANNLNNKNENIAKNINAKSSIDGKKRGALVKKNNPEEEESIISEETNSKSNRKDKIKSNQIQKKEKPSNKPTIKKDEPKNQKFKEEKSYLGRKRESKFFNFNNKTQE